MSCLVTLVWPLIFHNLTKMFQNGGWPQPEFILSVPNPKMMAKSRLNRKKES